MVHSRRKGHSRERAIRKRWIECGWPDSKRGDQSRAGHEESDVCVGERSIDQEEFGSEIEIPPFRCEVKDQLSLPGKRAMAAYDQAVRTANAGEIPMAVFHVARRGDYVLLDLTDLLRLASCGTSDGRPVRDGVGVHDDSERTEVSEVTNAASE